MEEKRIAEFQKTVWDFYGKNQREFPWRNTKTPYHILVSEIMLQQTQADRVVRYYKRWLERFPDFAALAKAPFSDIYPYWQGLGYNRRAMALKKLAQVVIEKYQGELPKKIPLLEDLPGIGPYTARAVSIFSFNTPVACIETNIRRVFIYHFFSPSSGTLMNADTNADFRGYKVDDKDILKLAELALDKKNSREWHYALMDYGAYLRLNPPAGGPNPNRRHKNYAVQSKFEGSLRQIRGAALRMLSANPMSEKEIQQRLKKATLQTLPRIKKVLAALEKEALITYDAKKKVYRLN